MPLGFRTILLEYPGYGSWDGGWSEAELAGDVAALIRMARAQFGVPLYLLGESLGGGVAAAAAAQAGDQLQGLVLITSWDRSRTGSTIPGTTKPTRRGGTS